MDLSELDPDERARWERYILTGIHTFLFVDHVEGETRLRDSIVNDLITRIPEHGEPPPDDAEYPVVVLSAAEFIGPYKAFIHLWAPPDRLDALHHFIAYDLWDLGLRCNYATQGTSYQGPGTTYPLKIKRCDIVAVVRIWAEKGSLGEIPARLAELPGFQGAATVFGDFDILLVLDGPDFATVSKTAIGPLQTIPGIKRTETAFADYRIYDEQGEGAEV
jgi:DNA-binding Lrp family transcriptional regulator